MNPVAGGLDRQGGPASCASPADEGAWGARHTGQKTASRDIRVLQRGQWTARPTIEGGIHSGGGAAETGPLPAPTRWSGWGVSTTPWGIVQPQFEQNNAPATADAPQCGQNATLR